MEHRKNPFPVGLIDMQCLKTRVTHASDDMGMLALIFIQGFLQNGKILLSFYIDKTK